MQLRFKVLEIAFIALLFQTTVQSQQTTPNFKFPGHFNSLESIDWKNTRLPIFDDQNHLEEWVQFKDGRLDVKGKEWGGTSYGLSTVHFIGEPAKFAVLELWEDDCGGSCTNWGKVEVLKFENHSIEVVQKFSFENRGGGSSFDPIKRILEIRETNYGHGAHCCPEFLDVSTYRWTGVRFRKISKTKIPQT